MAFGDVAFAHGTGVIAEGLHSTAFGNSTQALKDNLFVVGKFNNYNKTVDGEYFVVGAGSEDSDRINAFTVGRSFRTNEPYIKIGDIELTETQLIKLKALLNEE
jgi:hypothetical protein